MNISLKKTSSKSFVLLFAFMGLATRIGLEKALRIDMKSSSSIISIILFADLQFVKNLFFIKTYEKLSENHGEKSRNFKIPLAFPNNFSNIVKIFLFYYYLVYL